MKWSDFLIKPTQYSNFDISTTKRFSMSYGMLIPAWWRIMNPGDTFDMNIRTLVRTNPVKSPLMGRFKMRTVTVVSNFKNYAVGLEGYHRSFDWRNFVLPNLRLSYPKVLDNSLYKYGAENYSKLPLMAVRETSLADYLGMECGFLPSYQLYGSGDEESSDTYRIYKSALPFLVYFDYYRNYMVNPQEGVFPHFVNRCSDPVVYHANNTSYPNVYLSKSCVEMYPIEKLDHFFSSIHKYFDGSRSLTTSSLTDAVGGFFGVSNDSFVYWGLNPSFINPTPMSRVNDFAAFHGGLCCTMFDPDINTQWLSETNYRRLNEVKVNTQTESSTNFVSYGDIVKASSLWDFISREIYNGGTYADHIYSQFGVSVRGDLNIPQIVHVFDNMINFEDITSQSDTSNGDESNPLGAKVGQQFGVGRGFGQSSRFKIRNIDNNYAIAMTFVWITPMVDYSTGLSSEFNINQFSDLYTPAFDNYSMQPRLQEQYYAGLYLDGDRTINPLSNFVSANVPHDYVIGYQPSYADYKTDVNRVHGLFANQLSYWAILRKAQFYSPSNYANTYKMSSYVFSTPEGTFAYEKDAVNCYVPFSVVDEDNFFVQMRFDIKATRPMSKSVMPHVK